jgi:hypothetical protein
VAQIALGKHDSAIATIRQGLVVDNNNLPLTKLLRKAQQQKKVSMAQQQSNLVHNDNAAHGEATSQLRIPNVDGMTLDRIDTEQTNATEIRMYAQQQKKEEVDRYNQMLMATMSMTGRMMKDPKQSENPAKFTMACDFLRRLRYGRIPPSIHKELLPCLLDVIRRHAPLVELVKSVLYRGHLNARSHPWMQGLLMVMGTDRYKEDDDFYMQRYQGTWRWKVVQDHPQLFLRVGAMIVSDPDTNEPLSREYHRDLRTQLSNAPTFPNHDHRNLGPTHIALGFNDLQILLHFATTHQQQQQQLLPSTSSNDVPIRFTGYDRST